METLQQNESNRDTSNPQGKSVFQEVSPSGSPYGPWQSVASGIGMPLFVEGPASFADNVTPGKYVSVSPLLYFTLLGFLFLVSLLRNRTNADIFAITIVALP